MRPIIIGIATAFITLVVFWYAGVDFMVRSPVNSSLIFGAFWVGFVVAILAEVGDL